MFHRRLKILLLLIFLAIGVILLRCAQVQIAQRGHWSERAAATQKRSRLLETTRGRILDSRGREIAVDVPCIDACVDYRALRPAATDQRWLSDQARKRLLTRMGDEYRKANKTDRAAMLKNESAKVLEDIDHLWPVLAQLSGQTLEQIDETRRGIIRRVEMRRRLVWYASFARALKRQEQRDPPPWYRAWLVDPQGDTPELDDFDVRVTEQIEPHVVLAAIDVKTNNFLAKNIDRFPGLVLRPSTHRYYPYKDAAPHVLGRLSRVTREDLDSDPDNGVNELRQYLPNDLIGRTGLEALCERQLRGTRGRELRDTGEERVVDVQSAQVGKDVRVSLDIELQQDIQRLFEHAPSAADQPSDTGHPMHGAAVLLDVATGNTLALVSSPVFDANQVADNYAALAVDEINTPLLNRATQAQLEMGSTIKPLVGLAAISAHVLSVNEGIECTGYLVLNGHRYAAGRCWVASKFFTELGGHVAHHPVPWDDPHPTGFLNFSDALQRSCNIYFETAADRLGLEGLSYWYDQFGLGRLTGIGIAESAGRLPNSYLGPSRGKKMTTWFAGIGQGQVAATPLQMANVAATIARNGLWMRPRLIDADAPKLGEDQDPAPLPAPSATADIPDRVQLPLDPAALAAARDGMVRVVNSRAGTGKEMHREDVLVAGKTGTAQAARFSIVARDAEGRILRDQDGQPQREFLSPSTTTQPNPRAPWYTATGREEKDLAHAWFIGFAPAKNPQVAFAVMVEYGGSGGIAAARIAQGVLDTAIEHGYLTADKSAPVANR